MLEINEIKLRKNSRFIMCLRWVVNHCFRLTKRSCHGGLRCASGKVRHRAASHRQETDEPQRSRRNTKDSGDSTTSGCDQMAVTEPVFLGGSSMICTLCPF